MAVISNRVWMGGLPVGDWPKDARSVTGHGKDVKDDSGFEKKRGHEPSNVGELKKLKEQGTGAPWSLQRAMHPCRPTPQS